VSAQSVTQMSTQNTHKKKRFWGVESGRRVSLATSLPSVSRLSRKRGILNISLPHRPPWSVTGLALLLVNLMYKCQFLGSVRGFHCYCKEHDVITVRNDRGIWILYSEINVKHTKDDVGQLV
jgi:hypothetical protein